MKTVLVTGSKGQLGQEILNAVNSCKPFYEGDKFKYVFTDRSDLDITNKQQCKEVFEKCKPNIVINCAAFIDVEKAEVEKEHTFQVNVVGAYHLASLCKEYDATLIHISSNYVFDGKNYKPYKTDEASPKVNHEGETTNRPVNFYGMSKRLGEIEVEQSGCKYIIIRTSGLYSKFGKKNFVKAIMRKCFTNGVIVNVVDDQILTPTNALSLANFILRDIILPEKTTSEYNGIYHYTDDGVCSWYDMAKIIEEVIWSKLSASAELRKKYPEYPISGNRIVPISSEEFNANVNRPYFTVLDKKSTFEKFKIDFHGLPTWRQAITKCVYEILDEDLL